MYYRYRTQNSKTKRQDKGHWLDPVPVPTWYRAGQSKTKMHSCTGAKGGQNITEKSCRAGESCGKFVTGRYGTYLYLLCPDCFFITRTVCFK